MTTFSSAGVHTEGQILTQIIDLIKIVLPKKFFYLKIGDHNFFGEIGQHGHVLVGRHKSDVSTQKMAGLEISCPKNGSFT